MEFRKHVMMILNQIVIFLTAAAAVVFLFFLFLLSPFRIRSPFTLSRRIRGKKVPHRLNRTGQIPWLEVNRLPYPGTFDHTDRERMDLNGSWGFRTDPDRIGLRKKWYKKDRSSEKMTVPSCFNPVNSQLTDYKGTVWYWKNFDLNIKKDSISEIYRLCFEGILLRGEVWLNGRHLGYFEGGYTGIYFDLTPHLQKRNLLAVRCSNSLKKDSLPPEIMKGHNPGWHTYGGIYRDVYIERLPPGYVVKVHAEPEELPLNRIQYRISILTREGSTEEPELILTDPAGSGIRGRLLEYRRDPRWKKNRISGWTYTFLIKKPIHWELGSDSYYRLSVGFQHDRVELNLGLRTIQVEPGGILVNSRKIFLKGISRHEDHPDLGSTESPELIRQDLALAGGMQANYLRLAHYPHDGKFIRAAQAEGFFCSQELPLYQCGMGFLTWFQERRNLKEFPAGLAGIRHLSRRKLLINARRQLIEMIERDRHHPSILFWSLGNENFTIGQRSGKIFRWLKSIAKEYDPARPVTVVEITYNLDLLDKRKRGWDGADILSVNSYFGWYYGKPSDLETYLGKLRKYYPDRPLILSEFGAGAAPGRQNDEGYWKAERVYFKRTYSEEYQEKILREYWREARKHEWICGISPWILCDFYNVWFPGNPVPNYNLKGVCSFDRKPKKGWYALKKMYSEDQME